MTTKPIYLDYAAATPLDARVLAAMQPYFADNFYNPSATYIAGRRVQTVVEGCRHQVAQVLGARASEIIFTAGGTEANNIALMGVMARYPDKKLVVSAVEHESVLATAKQYDYCEVPVSPDGVINPPELLRLIDDTVVLVSVQYANNEVGTIQPLQAIAQGLEVIRNERRTAGNTLPLLLHTDATQAANYLDLHVSRLGVDLMTLNGGKVYGPKQTGVLYVRSGVMLRPYIWGGGQENGVRSGTENVPGIVGFATALEVAQAGRAKETRRLQALQHEFIELLEASIPGVALNGSHKKRLPNNVHVTIPGQDNERLLMALDEAGVMAAAGSACAASNEEPSHVLMAMGLPEAAAQSSLRFTMGRGTTKADIMRTASILTQLIA